MWTWLKSKQYLWANLGFSQKQLDGKEEPIPGRDDIKCIKLRKIVINSYRGSAQDLGFAATDPSVPVEPNKQIVQMLFVNHPKKQGHHGKRNVKRNNPGADDNSRPTRRQKNPPKPSKKAKEM